MSTSSDDITEWIRTRVLNVDESDRAFLKHLDAVAARGQYSVPVRLALGAALNHADIVYVVRRMMRCLPDRAEAVLEFLRFLIDGCGLCDVTEVVVGSLAAVWCEIIRPPIHPSVCDLGRRYFPVFRQLLKEVAPYYYPASVTDLPDPIRCTLAEFERRRPAPNQLRLLLPERIGAVFPDLVVAGRAITDRHLHLLRTDPDLVRILYGFGAPINLCDLDWAGMTAIELRGMADYLVLGDSDQLLFVFAEIMTDYRPDLAATLLQVRTVLLYVKEWERDALFDLCQFLIMFPEAIAQLVALARVRDALRTQTTVDEGWTLLHIAIQERSVAVARMLLSLPELGLRDRVDQDGYTAADYAADDLLPIFESVVTLSKSPRNPKFPLET